eukprot:SAG31_NODE_2519_length_5569_cov_4.141316_4_plen_69_part_00
MFKTDQIELMPPPPTTMRARAWTGVGLAVGAVGAGSGAAVAAATKSDAAMQSIWGDGFRWVQVLGLGG